MNMRSEQSRAELVPSNAPKRRRAEEDASAFPAAPDWAGLTSGGVEVAATGRWRRRGREAARR